MAGGENEIRDSVFCYFMDAYVMKEDCGGNCENYLPEKEEQVMNKFELGNPALMGSGGNGGIGGIGAKEIVGVLRDGTETCAECQHYGEPKTGRPKKRELDRPVVQYGEAVTYKLSPAEIEKRHGKPGEFAEPVSTAVTYGWPDMGERNERHYFRRDL